MGHLVRVQIRLSRFGLCSGWPTSVSVRVEFGSGPVLVECIRFGYGYGSSLVWIGSISKTQIRVGLVPVQFESGLG